MEWKLMVDKKVYVQVETETAIRTYQGVINEVAFLGKNIDGIEIWFISIIDKFGKNVGFMSNTIKIIQEEQ